MTLKTLMMSAATAALFAGGAAYAQDSSTDAQAQTEGGEMSATEGQAGGTGAELGTTGETGMSGEAGAEAETEMAEETPPQSLEEMTVGDMIGLPVQSTEGENIGEIDYLIDGPNGLEAVIGIGGFLGLGEYTVALPIGDFEFDAEQQVLILASTKEELKERPEFDETGVTGLPEDMALAELLSDDAEAGASATSGTSMGGSADTEAGMDDGAASETESDGAAEAEAEAEAETDMGAEAEAEAEAGGETEMESDSSMDEDGETQNN
ncbi:PRC-barrel domain-containing protein [Roseivivax sp.]